MLDDVTQFSLTYDITSTVEEFPAPRPVVESAEMELMGYNSTQDLKDEPVHNDKWWAQYFKPTLLADTVHWKVTRVRFVARRDNNNAAATLIQLRLPEADNRPGDTVVDKT